MIQDQPPPKRNDGPAMWDLVIADAERGAYVFGIMSTESTGLVIADMRQRKSVGIERYGVALQAHNGRDALVDAYQEALDMAVYLRQAQEEGDLGAPILYRAALDMVYSVRFRIFVRDGK